MTVVKAYLFTNGRVTAFDENGKQVPEYQGHRQVMVPKLRRNFPGLIIEGMDWATDFQNAPELWTNISNFSGMDWGSQ